MTAPVEHPSWCDPKECTVTADGNGFHRSTWQEIAHPDRAMTWGLGLSATPTSSRPWIDLLAVYPHISREWPETQVELAVLPTEAPQLATALLALATAAGVPEGGAA